MPGVSMPTSRWDDPQEAAIYKAELAAGSRIIAVQGRPIRTYSFDTAAYPLADIVIGLLVEKGFLAAADAARLGGDLTQLHRFVSRDVQALDANETNAVSRAFFDTNPAFVDAYERLNNDVLVEQVVHADCLFQRTPTMRFHFPHQDGCFWHPRIHNDLMLGHPPQEINVWLPLGRTEGTSGMRIADLEPSVALAEEFDNDWERLAHAGQHDPAFRRRYNAASTPVELAYGEFIVFDPRCIHATAYNVSDLTRISLDFRIIPVEDYDAMRLPYRGTGKRRMPFARGHYYHDQSAATLHGRARPARPALAAARP